MHALKRSAIGATALAMVGLTGGSLVATTADAAALGKVRFVAVHMGSHRVVLPAGNRIHAGRTIFRVSTAKGDHELQIARLRHGYTLAQAGADLGSAFGGNVPAIRRVDRNVEFRGGAEARPHHPGMMVVSLAAGHYLFLDQETNSVARVTVVGKRHPQRVVRQAGSIAALSFGFITAPQDALPRSGWVRVSNRSDQPHEVVINRVKANTTREMVRRYFASKSQATPAFALPANISSGVVSPHRTQLMHYNLPAGRYVVMCFWPDNKTGMPHAYMGMWKLVTLK